MVLKTGLLSLIVKKTKVETKISRTTKLFQLIGKM